MVCGVRAGGDRRVRAFAGPLDETDEVGVCHLREMPLFDGEALMDLNRRPDAISLACRIRHGVAGPEQLVHDAIRRAAVHTGLVGGLLHRHALGSADDIALDLDQQIEHHQQPLCGRRRMSSHVISILEPRDPLV